MMKMHEVIAEQMSKIGWASWAATLARCEKVLWGGGDDKAAMKDVIGLQGGCITPITNRSKKEKKKKRVVMKETKRKKRTVHPPYPAQ
jgi:hypothetical protein